MTNEYPKFTTNAKGEITEWYKPGFGVTRDAAGQVVGGICCPYIPVFFTDKSNFDRAMKGV